MRRETPARKVETKAAQHLIGVVPDESSLYPELTGFDNLCFWAALHGIFNPKNAMSFALNFVVLSAFCIFLFAWSLRNIKRRWIL